MNHILLYFLIFISKVVENALGTLRLIVVANGKKVLGAILQFVIALVWVLITGVVVVEISKDPLKIVFFAFGSLVGSYIGSLIEEKMALGNNLVTAIINSDSSFVINDLRNKGYQVTSLEGNGKDKKRTILLIMVSRKQRSIVVDIIKKYDRNSMIVSESARAINGYEKRNE